MFSQIWRRRDASAFGYPSTNHVELRLVTPPAVEPVSLTLVKQHARVFFNDADQLMAVYRKAARQRVEKYLRRALITQTWDFRCDWVPAWVELPMPDLQTVVGVFTTGLDNAEVQVPTSTYNTDAETNFVGLNIGNVWPLHRGSAGFRIRYTTGYGDTAASVPEDITRTILAVATVMETERDKTDLSALLSSVDDYRVIGEPYRMARGMSREDLLA